MMHEWVQQGTMYRETHDPSGFYEGHALIHCWMI